MIIKINSFLFIGIESNRLVSIGVIDSIGV
jgi:hypothetical protein